jgi:putative hydrolase of the HAD superfamily
MNDIRAICFDLDDTLWDLAPIIPRAENALYEWYRSHCPRVTEAYTARDIARLRITVATDNPELEHDLTALRMLTLQTIARETGYAEHTATEAFKVFQAVRNSVSLFDDVLPGLTKLKAHFRLFALSNGNANLESIGIAKFFEQSFSARELGVAKPDVAVFNAVCERADLAPEHVVHVGDHPENDIAAARRAGMVTIWVNRNDSDWPLHNCRPDHQVRCFEELTEVFGV